MSPTRHIVVVIRSAAPARVAEAYRAAVGLGLRGDRVSVVGGGAVPAAAVRAAATLLALGHRVDSGAGDAAIADAVRHADAVEVWT